MSRPYDHYIRKKKRRETTHKDFKDRHGGTLWARRLGYRGLIIGFVSELHF